MDYSFMPFWKNWLRQTIPHNQVLRLLEISFGTDYLLTQVANKFRVVGFGDNRVMAATAKEKSRRVGLQAELLQWE